MLHSALVRSSTLEMLKNFLLQAKTLHTFYCGRGVGTHTCLYIKNTTTTHNLTPSLKGFVFFTKMTVIALTIYEAYHFKTNVLHIMYNKQNNSCLSQLMTSK